MKWMEVATAMVQEERYHQVAKHGTHTCADPDMPESMALAILIEEVGEVGTAICDNEGDVSLMAELVQVAAVAVAWVEALLEKEDLRKAQLQGV